MERLHPVYIYQRYTFTQFHTISQTYILCSSTTIILILDQLTDIQPMEWSEEAMEALVKEIISH